MAMSGATVDERIAGLEHRRATETLTLKEEKEVMAEIKALRACPHSDAPARAIPAGGHGACIAVQPEWALTTEMRLRSFYRAWCPAKLADPDHVPWLVEKYKGLTPDLFFQVQPSIPTM